MKEDGPSDSARHRDPRDAHMRSIQSGREAWFRMLRSAFLDSVPLTKAASKESSSFSGRPPRQ